MAAHGLIPNFGIGIIVRCATRTLARPRPLRPLLSFLRHVGTRLTVLLLVAAVFGRARDAWQRRARESAVERANLPSIFDAHPAATRAPRRRIGLRSVPLERIVGTMRHPSQNTSDFLPLPSLRGQNWRGRWQRIQGATDRLTVLPPVELVQVGEEYYVVDGHNRVAASLMVGAAEIDADVTQLLLPGVTRPGQATLDASSLIGAEAVRQAGQGRLTRTVEQRRPTDELSKRDLLGESDRHE